ncbi:hypothetical protein [Pelagibius sp. Alg239-R121]|uniref:hypothetical protein n=1 Tax=Pelagibius sp. Alg239-R121 TaxID=2993448 RepID=UPI0024A6C816|nr:hypothetical protein [Pelagibius sp. Alg239-R121]
MLQTALFVLKIFSAILAGVFGAIGTVKEFRGEDGQVTTWGKVALVGVVVSSITAVSTQIVQELIDQQSAQKAAERIEQQIANQQALLERMAAQGEQSEAILSDLQRSLTKFNKISASAFIDLPDNVALAGRVEQELLAEYSILVESGAAYDGPVSPSRTSPDGIEEISIQPVSGLYPQSDVSNPFGSLLESLSLEVAFYQEPRADAEIIATRWSGEGQPDLQISFRQDHLPNLSYEFEGSKFNILQSHTSDSKFWDSSGEIISLSDLAGAQVYFYLTAIGWSGMQADVDSVFWGGVRNSVLETVILRIDELELWFRDEQLREFQAENGVTVWIATLPESLPEIFERHVR